jgi:hypothetical protein
MTERVETIIVNLIDTEDVERIGVFEEYGYSSYANDARSFALGYLCGRFGWMERDVYLRRESQADVWQYEVMVKGMPHPTIKIRFEVVAAEFVFDSPKQHW